MVDDFDPRESYEKLSANLNQPDKFSEIFCNAAKTQKNIDLSIKDIIKNLIKSDADVRKDFKEIVLEIEKEFFWLKVKNIGVLSVVIITSLITNFIQWWFTH